MTGHTQAQNSERLVPDKNMFTKILVPLDGSVFAEAVLPLVRDMAERNKTQIVLFHTVEPVLMTGGFSGAAMVNIDVVGLETEMRGDAMSYLERTAAHLRNRDIDVQVDLQSTGYVPGAIIDAVARHKADLIAMATNGRGGLGRALLGSVADQVLRQATVPLFLVRPDQSELTSWPGAVTATVA